MKSVKISPQMSTYKVSQTTTAIDRNKEHKITKSLGLSEMSLIFAIP